MFWKVEQVESVMGVIKKHQRNFYTLSEEFAMMQQLEEQEKELE